MNLETWLLYGLRLWLAGVMRLGQVLLQVGPFGLAGAGFTGWQLTQRPPTRAPRRWEEVAADGPAFILR